MHRRSGMNGMLAMVTLALVAAACSGGATARTGGSGYRAVSHKATRLDLRVSESFDAFVSRYESAVPAFSPEALAGAAGWEDVADRTAQLAPHGFLVYGKIDAAPVMRLNGHTQRAVTYLMGNHVIAETMYRHDPGVMLYAPLRTVVYEDGSGGVHFAVDQPSTRLGSLGDDDITRVGRQLDQKLAALLADLELPVPKELIGD